MAVGYNEQHIQVATKTGTPTWLDVAGAVSWEPAPSSDTTDIMADGTKYVTAYGSPGGAGDLVFLDLKLPVLAVLNGGTVSTTGTGPTQVEKYVQGATYVPPAIEISSWVPNIDTAHDSTVAGLRTTVLNAQAGLATRSSGQNSEQNWTVPTTFSADSGTNSLIIYEKMASAPAITAGVYAYP